MAILVACGTPERVEEDQPAENTEGVEEGSEENTDQEPEDTNEIEEDEGTVEDTEETNEADNEKTELPDLEESKQDILMIEGMEEDITINLFQHEALAFSTYIPEDMIAEYDQGFFNVYANFNDNKNEDARLFITNQEEGEITEYLEGLGFNLSTVDTPAYDFSEKEMNLEKEGFLGRVAFFTKHDEPYALAYYYPAEYGDGLSAHLSLWVKSFGMRAIKTQLKHLIMKTILSINKVLLM